MLRFAVCITAIGFAVAPSQQLSAQPTPQYTTEPPTKDTEAAALEAGLDLERAQDWARAIQHYEDSKRQFADSKSIYQRLVICRLHYDVNRRFQDPSYVKSIETVDKAGALDLYTEVLTNLETHYVGTVDWPRILLHGTASLEVALTEDRFIERLLKGVSPEKVDQFRQNVHRRLSGRVAQSKYDLRTNVAFVADIALTELGISETATILEYVSGAVSTLDPYTRLLSGDQLDEMFSNIEGNFVGLGVELETKGDSLRILSVIPKGPAEEAGIKAGDKIVRVESSRTSETDPDFVADLLRGPEHTFVSIGVVSPKGQERDLRVQRRRVDVPCVEHARIVNSDSRIGYLRLTNFQKTTTREVESKLWELHRQGMQSLILDLRGNPGGLLSAAVEVADRFLEKGRIVTTRGRNTRENFDYIAHRPNTWDIPLAVLIDSDSASASEIFAGAIADTGRGIIVGQTSYGKGSVQGIFRMQAAKFGLCLTTAKFYSPSGRAISESGVKPKFDVEPTYIALRPDDEGNLVTDQDDAILQKAIQQLTRNSQSVSLRIGE